MHSDRDNNEAALSILICLIQSYILQKEKKKVVTKRGAFFCDTRGPEGNPIMEGGKTTVVPTYPYVQLIYTRYIFLYSQCIDEVDFSS